MRNLCPILLGLSVAAAFGHPAAPAQTMENAPPKYLQVIVEYTKPGKGGMAHDKTETAITQAMNRSKFPIHYTGYTALTGKPRSIYLAGFDSMEEMAKAYKLTTGAEIDRVTAADGEMLEDSKTLIFKSVPELSFHSVAPSAKNRVMEASVFQVRPGHAKDFEELAKRVMSVYDKVGTSYHWGAYRILYGEQAGSYVLLTASNSASDIDMRLGDDPKITAAIGEEESKKLDELRAASIESSHREMYAANPAQSYVSDDWIKADPFWKVKASAAAPKAAEEKKPTP